MGTIQSVLGGRADVTTTSPSNYPLTAARNHPHPIHRIPTEVLSRIFWHALPAQPKPRPSEAPCNVSATCRSWRRVALATPSLWAQIWIGTASGPVGIRAAHVDVMEEWVSRSGSLPLLISLTFRCKTRGEPDVVMRHFRHLARTVSSVRGRWEVLELRMPTSCLRDILESGEDLYAPRLRELRAGGSEFPLLSKDGVQVQLDCFPALEKIDLSGCVSLLKTAEISTSCPRMLCHPPLVTKLKTLRVGLVHQPFELLSVLTHSPSLEDLDVQICISAETRFIPWKDRVHLPRLEKMWFQFLDIDAGRHSSCIFLDHLFAPNLGELTVPDSESQCSHLLRGLKGFLDRSQPPIQQFGFEKPFENAEVPEFIEVLQLVPTVKELRVQPNSFLTARFLTVLDGGSGLLPNLEVVNLDVHRGFEVPRIEVRKGILGVLLTAMVNSRRVNRTRFFRNIVYNGQEYEDPDLLLEELTETEDFSDPLSAMMFLDSMDGSDP